MPLTRMHLAAVLALASVVGCSEPTAVKKFRVRDALQTAAMEIHRRLHDQPEGLQPGEADAVFPLHHNASVSPIWLDEAGRPVDAWGTPFRVTHSEGGTRVTWVQCDSAGPDRKFDTEDDLSYRSTK